MLSLIYLNNDSHELLTVYLKQTTVYQNLRVNCGSIQQETQHRSGKDSDPAQVMFLLQTLEDILAL